VTTGMKGFAAPLAASAGWRGRARAGFTAFAPDDGWRARGLVVFLVLWLLLAVVALGFVGHAMIGLGKAEVAGMIVALFDGGAVFFVPIWLIVAGILMLLVNLVRRHGL